MSELPKKWVMVCGAGSVMKRSGQQNVKEILIPLTEIDIISNYCW